MNKIVIALILQVFLLSSFGHAQGSGVTSSSFLSKLKATLAFSYVAASSGFIFFLLNKPVSEEKIEKNFGFEKEREDDYAAYNLKLEPKIISKYKNASTLYICSEHKGIWGSLLLNQLVKISFPKCSFGFNIDPRLPASGYFSPEKCHLLFKGPYPHHEISNIATIPYISWTAEAGGVWQRHYPPLLNILNSCPHGVKRCVQVPFAINALLHFVYKDYDLFARDPSKFIPGHRGTNKTKLLIYAASHCVKERDDFFKHVLESDSNVTTHSIFSCLHNHDPETQIENKNWRAPQLVEYFSGYKFAMAMENHPKPGYVTEKIVLALMANTIPIYDGDNDLVKNLFNKDRIIFPRDFRSISECVAYIQKLSSDPVLYEEILSKPVFYDNELPDVIDFSSPKGPWLEAVRNILVEMEGRWENSELRQCLDPDIPIFSGFKRRGV